MFAPSRLAYSLRPHASPGLLAAIMVATTTFVATPFLLPEITAGFKISLGIAGLLSTAQVGAFAVVSFVAGRRLRPSVSLLRGSIAVFVVANAASALAPWFWLLLLVRAVAGGAAGLMAWAAWSDAAAEPRRLSDVAASGPVAAIVGAPLFGWLAQVGEDQAVFLAMAAVALVPLLMPMRLDAAEQSAGGRISPSRSNRVLLVALMLLTLSGSALFVYSAAAAQSLSGLSVAASSGAFSLNAVGGFLGSRLSSRGSAATPWIVVIGLSILAMVLTHNGTIFYVGMTVWGFGFWMAVPRVLRLLAERSYSPDERIGDAQGGMAFGRTLGPAAGAAFASSSDFAALGILAAAGTVATAGAVGGVEIYRRRGGDADVTARRPMTRWLPALARRGA